MPHAMGGYSLASLFRSVSCCAEDPVWLEKQSPAAVTVTVTLRLHTISAAPGTKHSATYAAASRNNDLPRGSRALLAISIESRFFFELRLTDVLGNLFQASPAQKKPYSYAVPQ